MNTIWEVIEDTGRTEVQAHTARRFPFVVACLPEEGVGPHQGTVLTVKLMLDLGLNTTGTVWESQHSSVLLATAP